MTQAIVPEIIPYPQHLPALDLLHELAILEDKALGDTKHGVYRL
jgi:hypothetical protein